jgi:hypothetical protein
MRRPSPAQTTIDPGPGLTLADTKDARRRTPYRRAGLLALAALLPVLGSNLGLVALERYGADLGRRTGPAPSRPKTPRPPAPAAVADPYEAGHARGRAEAYVELALGTPCLYGYGFPGNVTDARTGLPYKWVAGCVIDERILGRVDGHNAAIRSYFGDTSLTDASDGGMRPRAHRPGS